MDIERMEVNITHESKWIMSLDIQGILTQFCEGCTYELLHKIGHNELLNVRDHAIH
jgi:hypothetical protein